MTTRTQKVALGVMLLATMIGSAPTVADAKQKSLRARVRILEKRIAVLDLRISDAQDSADVALGVLSDCIDAVAVDPFTLPGTDPSLDRFPLGLSRAADGVAPAYWVAIIDGACLDPATMGAVPRSFGPRIRRLDGAPATP